MVSVCSTRINPELASSVLCKHYATQHKATELVILGDFDKLAAKKEDCHHGIFQGEALGDCLPESFDTYAQYEDTITKFPYGNNYVFKDRAWWEVTSSKGKLTYRKLKKRKK